MAGATRLPQLLYREKFREYQAGAIDMVRRYKRRFTKAGNSEGAALVYHPTGTGKTAVIAGLAHAAPEIGNVLVLTTREAIRDQLARELAGNIFIEADKFGLGEATRLEKVVYAIGESTLLGESAQKVYEATSKHFLPSLQEFALKQFKRLVSVPNASFTAELSRNRAILIMTVQMLIGLKRDGGAIYDAIKNHVDLVLFDEGHYEPAVKYSAATRGLGKPIALMSATPFRNDLKPFLVKTENIDIYKFAKAIAERVIRDVKVVQRAPTRDAKVFCADVVDFCREKFGNNVEVWPRIIIHCDDASSIARLGDEFISGGFTDKVVGIHDQFHRDRAGHKPWMHRSVPPPRQTDALIWIHQYKLMEGIDDHRFRVLAFFDPLKNVRSVVQQIGRVIRTLPSEREDAIVLDHYRGRVAQYWALYREYDESISAEYLTKTLSRYYLDQFIAVQPKIDYIERKFRQRLDLRDIPSPNDEILFDRKVTFKSVGRHTKLADLEGLVETHLAIEDYESKKYSIDNAATLYVMAKVESPEFLHTRYFAEARHGSILLSMFPPEGLLAITTVGAAPEGLNHLQSIGPDKLERLLQPGEAGRISSVTSRNTNLGNRVIRRRTISAPSIADVPPILDEYGHVVATVTGYNGTSARVSDDLDYQQFVGDNFDIVEAVTRPDASSGSTAESLIRRYIGFFTGRVSEVGPPLRLEAFRSWVKTLIAQMHSGIGYSQVYDRYAELSKSKVKKGRAVNLLLDILDFADQYVHKDTREEMRGDELCVDSKSSRLAAGRPTSTFDVAISDETYEVEVTFNPATQRYKCESPALDDVFVRSDGRSLPLGRALNDAQAFNVIPEDKGVIYVHGRFYAPGLKYGDRFSEAEFFAGHCLYPSTMFKNLASEKGKCVLAKGERYDPDCLFDLIDCWKKGFDSKKLKLSASWVKRYNPEHLSFIPTLSICDDMNKENADFILADRVNRRVVLIHAKASKKFKKYSASAVQEVCAQAQKNTSLFSTFSLQRPRNFALWGGPHKFTGDGKISLTVKKRIRKPNKCSAKEAWEELSSLLLNPLTAREIWLVLGNMLSAEKFYEGLKSKDPAPETLQLNHLLQTTIAAAASVGAKTRIFCAP